MVPKPNRGIHPILLKSLNKFLCIPCFSYGINKVNNCLSETRGTHGIHEHLRFLCNTPQWFLRFAVAENHLLFSALPFDLSSVPRLFTKILPPLLTLFRTWGIQVTDYLDDLLLKDTYPLQFSANVQNTSQQLHAFGWVKTSIKSALQPSLHLAYLDLILNISQVKVFVPEKKALDLRAHARQLWPKRNPRVRFAKSSGCNVCLLRGGTEERGLTPETCQPSNHLVLGWGLLRLSWSISTLLDAFYRHVSIHLSLWV